MAAWGCRESDDVQTKRVEIVTPKRVENFLKAAVLLSFDHLSRFDGHLWTEFSFQL